MMIKIGITTLVLIFLLILQFKTSRRKSKSVSLGVEDIIRSLRKGKKVELTLKDVGEISWLKQERNKKKSSEEKIVYTSLEEALKEYETYLPVLSEKSKEFLKELLPLISLFKQHGTLKSILEILSILSKRGNIPSVAGSGYPGEPIQYKILKGITLEDHSIRTARIGLKKLRKDFSHLAEILPDKYLIMFLGHDIGKTFISSKRGYTTGDHPIFSGKYLSEILPDNLEWKEAVIWAVKNHHMKVSEDDSPEVLDLKILQEADYMAREEEIKISDFMERSVEEDEDHEEDEKTEESTDSNISVKHDTISDLINLQPAVLEQKKIQSEDSLSSWIHPSGIGIEEFFRTMLPWVNRLIKIEDTSNPRNPIPPDTPEGSFIAVSQPDGIVYVRPDFIYQTFLTLVLKKKVKKANASLLAMNKNIALRHIVSWLIKNECVAPGHVKEGFFGRWYSFAMKDKRATNIFTPLKAESFGVLPSELEERRKNTPKVCDIHDFKKAQKPTK